jgi:hypothetical protein
MIIPHGLTEAALATEADAIIATDRSGIINSWESWRRSDPSLHRMRPSGTHRVHHSS